MQGFKLHHLQSSTVCDRALSYQIRLNYGISYLFEVNPFDHDSRTEMLCARAAVLCFVVHQEPILAIGTTHVSPFLPK